MEKDFYKLDQTLTRLSSLLKKGEIGTFEAFLEYIIAQHSFSITKDFSNASKELKEAYFNCYREYILLQHLKINTKGLEWYDAFGLYFETYSSKWSKEKKGQFFTPENLCEFMARCNISEDMEKQTILDPTCGSGRLLLASHACNPKNYHYGQDIDYTCCLMATVNMMMHGLRGEIVWGNALDPNSYFSGWAINPNILKLQGIPHIERLEKENSFIFHVSQSQYKERQEEIKQEKEAQQERLKNANFLEVDEKEKLNLNDNRNEKTSFDFF